MVAICVVERDLSILSCLTSCFLISCNGLNVLEDLVASARFTESQLRGFAGVTLSRSISDGLKKKSLEITQEKKLEKEKNILKRNASSIASSRKTSSSHLENVNHLASD